MKVPLGRIMAMRGRSEADKVMREAVQRLRLAISEVRVVEQRKDGKVVNQTVTNYAGIVRARQAYMAAANVIGRVRREEEGTTGKPRVVLRPGIQAAVDQLEECRREIERLQGLTV
jgi:hypothetical protein